MAEAKSINPEITTPEEVKDNPTRASGKIPGKENVYRAP
jgi:hypothetical protein